MSEIIASNLFCRSFSRASSVVVLIVNRTPNASIAARSNVLLEGRSSTHNTFAPSSRLAVLGLLASLTTFAIWRACSSFGSCFSSTPSVIRLAEAAPSNAAASNCLLPLASSPEGPALKLNSPILSMNFFSGIPKYISRNTNTTGQAKACRRETRFC